MGKLKKWGEGGGRGGSGRVLGGSGKGGQGGCERRIKVSVKIQKRNWGGRGGQVGVRLVGGGGVRVDVNEELKFFGKFKKKNGGVSGRRGESGTGWGSGWM